VYCTDAPDALLDMIEKLRKMEEEKKQSEGAKESLILKLQRQQQLNQQQRLAQQKQEEHHTAELKKFSQNSNASNSLDLQGTTMM